MIVDRENLKRDARLMDLAMKLLDDLLKDVSSYNDLSEQQKSLISESDFFRFAYTPLESLVSDSCYKEIVKKLKATVGRNSFRRIFPAVKSILESQDGTAREEIRNWLDIDSYRVCSHCGAIMQEGWYLDCHGYACSDDCCCKIMNITKEEYDRYSIFLPEIEEFLKDEGRGRKPEQLTKEEINEIIDEVMAGLDAYYYTEWY